LMGSASAPCADRQPPCFCRHRHDHRFHRACPQRLCVEAGRPLGQCAVCGCARV
jgi:hypothetical protein